MLNLFLTNTEKTYIRHIYILMAIDQSKLKGSKLNGISSGELLFTTKGQVGTEANSTPIKSNPSKTYIKSDEYNKSHFTYTRSAVDLSQGAQKMDWSWVPWHNTPGNVTGTFAPYITGTGSSSSSRTSIDGESKKILLNSQFKYNFTSNQKDDLTDDVDIYMDFAKNDRLDEDGATNVHAKTMERVDNSDGSSEQVGGIGLIAYNTPNPTISLNIVSSNTTIADIYNSSTGTKSSTALITEGKLTGADTIVINPNVPDSKLGYVSGTVTVTGDQSNSSISGQSKTLYITNNGSGFSFFPADNTNSVTNDREATVKFTCTGMTDNVNGLASSAFTKEFKVYQSGGNVTLPDPDITYSWINSRTDYATLTPTKVGNYDSKATLSWKDNSGTRGSMTNKSGTKIAFVSNPINPEDNIGSTQTLQLTNFQYTLPTNTSNRSLSVTGIVSCKNDYYGVVGKLNGNDQYSNGTLIGKSSTITMTQLGVTWPNPGTTVNLSVTPHSTNPSNVTNDTSRVPKCTLQIEGYSSEGTSVNVPVKYNSNPKIYLKFNDMRPSALTATVSGNLTLTSTSSSSPMLVNLSNSASVNGSSLSFGTSDIPAMASCSWDLKINSASNDNNVTGTCSVDSTPVTITVPGNSKISGGTSIANFSVSSNNSKFSCTSSFSLSSTSKSATIYISGTDNSCSASYAKVTDSEATVTSNDKCDVVANIYTDRHDTGNENGQITVASTNFSSTITIKNNPIYVRTSGHNVGGTIDLVASVVSGPGSFDSTTKTVTFATDTSKPALFVANRDRGKIEYIPIIASLSKNLDGFAASIDVEPTNKPDLTNAVSWTGKITGTIKGTAITGINNTSIQTDNGSTFTVPGKNLNVDDYYYWYFESTPNVTGVSISNATSRKCTLNVPENPNKITGEGSYTDEWLISNNLQFNTSNLGNGTTIYKVKGKYNGTQKGYHLGNLHLRYTYNGAESNTYSIDHPEKSGGYSSITRNFSVSTTNAYCNLSSSSITSSDDNTATLSISSIGTRMDYTDASISDNESTAFSKTGSGSSIGAFDTATTVTIGATVSSEIKWYISMPSNVTITCTSTNTSRSASYKSTLQEEFTNSSSKVSMSASWMTKTNGGSWSNDSTTSITRSVTTTPSTPGTREFRLDSVTVKVTIDSSHSYTKTYSLGYEWKFEVDGKHYYNA